MPTPPVAIHMPTGAFEQGTARRQHGPPDEVSGTSPRLAAPVGSRYDIGAALLHRHKKGS